MDRDLLAQIWPVFFAEAREHLHEIGDGVLEMERGPVRRERLDSVRRVAHSLKGAAASLGFEDIERIAHGIEDSISGVDVARGVSRAAVVAVLDAVEAVEEALHLADEGGEGAVDRAAEILHALAAVRPERSPPPAAAASRSPMEGLERLEACLAAASDPGLAVEARRAAAGEGAALAARLGAERGDLADLATALARTFPAAIQGGVEGARAAAAAAGLLVELSRRTGGAGATRASGELGPECRASPVASPGAVPVPSPPVASAPAAVAPGPGDPPVPQVALGDRRAASDQSIRVLAGTVDSLSRRIDLFLPALARAARRARDMVAFEASTCEAVAVLRQLGSQLQAGDSPGLAAALSEVAERLSLSAAAAGKLGRQAAREAEAQRLVAAAIREELRTLRMVPAALALEPLRRAVRDAAVRLGKEVDLTVSGHEVKLDRRILDALRDPLLHLVRNAVDHGIESAQARSAASKPPAGLVSVRVEPRGDRVGIAVEDDGAGLDLERLKASAVRRGAITAAAAQAMSADEAARLVFLPGLSTASEVTALSGRGVGLDVVNEAVLRLGGRVTLSFVPGRGTRFVLDLPLTLATTIGIVVRVGRDVAVVPSEGVERVLRIGQGELGTVAGTVTVAVEGVHLPLAHLGGLLGLRAAKPAATLPALVLAGGGSRVAVAVDALVGQEEVVVSALGARAARVSHLAGATVLDDGRVVPVLNVAELVRRVRPGAERAAAGPSRARVVVADDSLTTRVAMKSLLEIAGYEVLPASDGEEALELLRQTRCDLVVTDVQMPRLDGLGLTRAVKADPRLAAIPVILVTSLGSDEDRSAGLAAGADGYLVKKEVQAGRLLELVRQLLPARP